MKKYFILFYTLFVYTSNIAQNIYSDNSRMDYVSMLQKYTWEDSTKVFSLIEPYIKIDIDSTVIKLGSSKFGGTPDLPKEIKWPYYEDRAMVFLAQINFEDISLLKMKSNLPKKGMLYFFQYFERPINEFGCNYLFQPIKNSYKIIYYNGECDNLINTSFPKRLFPKYHFKNYQMKFLNKFQIISSTETIKYELANLSKADDSTLNEFNNQNQEFIYTTNSIFGTPSPIQYGVDVDWALTHLGYTFEKMKTDDYKKIFENKVLRKSFVNLLSFEFGSFFSIIGSSKCFIGITQEDLENENFGNALMIHQN